MHNAGQRCCHAIDHIVIESDGIGVKTVEKLGLTPSEQRHSERFSIHKSVPKGKWNRKKMIVVTWVKGIAKCFRFMQRRDPVIVEPGHEKSTIFFDDDIEPDHLARMSGLIHELQLIPEGPGFYPGFQVESRLSTRSIREQTPERHSPYRPVKAIFHTTILACGRDALQSYLIFAPASLSISLMYPDLSYLFHDLLGTAPDNWLSVFKTFGVFLILAFLASAWVLSLELQRKEKEGLLHGFTEKTRVGYPATWQEIALNALFGFILGFKLPYIIQHFEEFRPDPASIVLSGKGTLLWGLLAAVVFGYFKYQDHKKRQLSKPYIKDEIMLPHQRIGDITILAAISGIVGARLFSILESEENIRAFIKDPLDQLLSGSGLAIYGGLILAFIVVYMYVRRKGMTPIHVMDAVAPALIMGYAVGRLGCQFSGDGDWGIVNLQSMPAWWFLPEWAWSYTYPHNVLNDGIPIEGCQWEYCRELPQGVYPTPIWETFFSLIIFGILWMLRKRVRIAGVLFFLYVFLNGVERYFIEKIRTNPDINVLGMEATQAEYVSGLLILTGLGGMVYLWINRRR